MTFKILRDTGMRAIAVTRELIERVGRGDSPLGDNLERDGDELAVWAACGAHFHARAGDLIVYDEQSQVPLFVVAMHDLDDMYLICV